MGKLLLYNEVIERADYYFVDAHWSIEKKRFTFAWPSKQYPYVAYIHQDRLNNTRKIKIRQWCEKNSDDSVIHKTTDHTYRYMMAPRYTWDYSYEISNIWHGFYFAEEAECLLFKLAFADIGTPITLHHPDSPEHEEVCKLTPGERAAYYEKARNNKKD